MNRLIIVFLVLSFPAMAQKIPDYGNNKVRIAASDKIIQAELQPVNNDPDIETDRTYFWYSSNAIHTTQGGYSGRLLNGKYTEYYLNKDLKQDGEFKKGLKQGQWKDWSENGILLQLYTWKNGVKQGAFNLFDEKGVLKQTGNYNDNLLQGKVRTYDNGAKSTVVHYKDGVVVTPKTPFFKRLKIFKKRSKSNKAKPVPVQTQ